MARHKRHNSEKRAWKGRSYKKGGIRIRALKEEGWDCLSLGGRPPAEEKVVKRHRWKNGSTCLDCGLHREGRGSGSYGALRYYRDEGLGYYNEPGPCPGTRQQTSNLGYMQGKGAA